MTYPHIAFFAGLVQGGAEKQVVQTAQVLVENGHQVTLFTYDLSKAFYRPDPRIHLVDLKPERPLKPAVLDKFMSPFRLAHQIRLAKPAVIVSYTTLLNLILSLTRCLTRDKNRPIFIGSDRNSRLRYNTKRFWRWTCRLLYRQLDGVFSNSRETVHNLNQLLKLNTQKTCYLPNVLDTDYFSPQTDDPSQIPTESQTGTPNQASKPYRILIPARVTEQKNQHSLLAVADLFRQHQESVVFVLSGQADGAYAKTLIQDMQQQALTPYFELLGSRSDIRELYHSSDLVFLPSRYEGLSNSMIEAMACEALVLGSDIEPFRDLIVDGETGFIVPVTDPLAIYAKIKQIQQLNHQTSRLVRAQARQSVLPFGRTAYYENWIAMIKRFDPAGPQERAMSDAQ